MDFINYETHFLCKFISAYILIWNSTDAFCYAGSTMQKMYSDFNRMIFMEVKLEDGSNCTDINTVR